MKKSNPVRRLLQQVEKREPVERWEIYIEENGEEADLQETKW